MTLKSTMMPTKLSPPFRLAWKPHGYMRKAVKFMLLNSCAGLLLDPGLGKTSISLAALKVLLKEKLVECGLVIAPLRVCYSVWPKEADKWADFAHLKINVLHGKNKEKALAEDADLYLINPEGLKWLLKHPLFKKRFKEQMLIVDESSKFKDTQTQRFKMLRPFLSMFARRYILTGSFAPNGLMDIFGQMFILDLGAALGSYITHYRSRYFYPTGFGGYDWKLQQGADKLIQDRIRPLTLRLDADDYLELPKLIINPIYVDLDDKAREIYDEMEEELIAAIEKKDVVAATAAVASNKCCQIANGGIYDEEGKAHLIHNFKSEAVSDLLSELGGVPALIAYEFGHDLERLRLALGPNTPYIGGGVTPKRSTELEEAWNAGKLPALLGQPASLAHGLNLQNAGNHVIWHSLTWNFEYYDQFNRRIRRQGSLHDKVFVHQIIARNTVDELKLQALNRKFRTQKDLFDALNLFLKSRKRSLHSTSKNAITMESGNGAESTTYNQEKTMTAKFAKKTAATEEAAPAAKPKGFAKVSKGAAEAQEKAAPAAKPAKAEKAPKAEAAPKEADTRKIKVLVKENPYREGSNRAARFDLLIAAKTVQEAYDAGVRTKDIGRAVENDLITVG